MSDLDQNEAAAAIAGLLDDEGHIASNDAEISDQDNQDDNAEATDQDPDQSAEADTPDDDQSEGKAESEPDDGDSDEGELPDTWDGLAEAIGLSGDELAARLSANVTIDGQVRPVNLAEALNGYQRLEDYRQKTGAIAEERKAFDAEREQARQTMQQEAQRLLSVLGGMEQNFVGAAPDPALASEDPAEYTAQKAQYDARRAAYDQMLADAQKPLDEARVHAQQRFAEVRKEQAAALMARRPELTDEKTGTTERAALKSYLTKQAGFSADDVDGLIDARTIDIAWKAMKYDEIQAGAKDIKTKKLKKLPKFVPSGSATSKADRNRDANAALRSKLRKSGHINDAAAVIRDMI